MRPEFECLPWPQLLRSLLDRGYITDAEYDEKRRAIVDGV
jgi:hypothetical protein